MAVQLGCDSGHISFSVRTSGHGPKHLGLTQEHCPTGHSPPVCLCGRQQQQQALKTASPCPPQPCHRLHDLPLSQ